MRPDESDRGWVKWVIGGVALLLVIVAGGMAGCPHYEVWQQSLSGKAKLAEATYSRQIKVQEAEAAKESAKKLAEAEVERARGAAEANKIIGQSLHGNDAYLRYLWIQTMSHETGREVIYVPTEAGLPVLEAGRFAQQKAVAPR